MGLTPKLILGGREPQDYSSFAVNAKLNIKKWLKMVKITHN